MLQSEVVSPRLRCICCQRQLSVGEEAFFEKDPAGKVVLVECYSCHSGETQWEPFEDFSNTDLSDLDRFSHKVLP